MQSLSWQVVAISRACLVSRCVSVLSDVGVGGGGVVGAVGIDVYAGGGVFGGGDGGVVVTVLAFRVLYFCFCLKRRRVGAT